jgi:hypothetical protein
MREIRLSLVSCFATFHAAINPRTLTRSRGTHQRQGQGRERRRNAPSVQMTWLTAVVRSIEGLNERIGRAVSWLAVLLVLNTCLVAVLRYGFSRGWVWLQESYVWMHAIEGATRLLDYKDHPELDEIDKLVVEYAVAVTNHGIGRATRSLPVSGSISPRRRSSR